MAARALRTLRSWVLSGEHRCAVLLYHRIVDQVSEDCPLGVSISNFEAQLAWLKKEMPVMTYADMVVAAMDGRLPKRSAVITFDDGYADNYHLAKPILVKYGMPAIFFITAGMIGTQDAFWWDEVEELMLANPQKVSVLDIRISGEHLSFGMENDADRRQSLNSLLSLLKAATGQEIDDVRKQIRHWAGRAVEGLKMQSALSKEELIELSKNPLFTIGSHSVSHVPLLAQNPETQQEEILKSKKMLEEWIDQPISYFAYPFGLPGEHFDYSVERRVARAGYESACSTANAYVCHGQFEIYRVPRFNVQNWDEAHFKENLLGFFKA